MNRIPIVNLALFVALMVGHLSKASAAAPGVDAQLDATLAASDDSIWGSITYTWTNTDVASQTKVPLWLYPNRFRKPNPGLDEGMLRWVYPGDRHAAGGMEILGVRWNGRKVNPSNVRYRPLAVPGATELPDVMAEVTLPSPLLIGETGHLTVSFKVTVPKRRGRFGRDGGVVTLGGGWYPMMMTGASLQDPSVPLDTVRISARVALPAGRGAVLHDAVFPPKKSPQQIEIAEVMTDSLVLVVMDRMEISSRVYGWGRAVHVHQSLNRREPTWRESGRDNHGMPEALPQPGRFDYSERMFDVVGNTAAIINEIAPEARLAKRIVLVDVPAWDRLVQPGFGPVLVSDRQWRLLPVKDGLFFHDLALVRAVAPTLVFASALRKQNPLYRFIAADMIGVFFSDYYSKTVHKRLRSVEDIIGFARMFPTIDNLLYAPQIPFREVYFRFYEEPEPLRDEPWMFMNRLPRGKRILAKLDERGGRTKVFDAVRALIEEGEPFARAVEGVLGENPATFLRDWMGPYPQLNYRLGEIRDVPVSNGRIRHQVDVVREGRTVREKVVIRMTDEDGLFFDAVWDEAGRGTTVSWISRAPLDKVEIDPNLQLVESPALTPDHPLRDNTEPLPWRPPMFTQLMVWADLTTGEPYVDVGFWLRRKYDNTNIFSLDLAYTPYAAGGTFSYYRFFGKKRTLNARTWYLGPTVSAIRYGEVNTPALHLSSDMRQSAVMGAAGLLIGRNTRTYGWDPMTGSAVSARAIYAAGSSADGTFRQMGRISLRAGKLFSLGIHHTIALYGGGAAVLGNPVAANMTSLSDRLILRGFDSDETFGRIGMYAVAEYRHTLFDAARLPAPLYSWFDRFQGALFLGGGTISKPSGALDGIFTAERLFTEVGYGIRIHLLFLGVHQYLLCFDLAVPLTPTDRFVEYNRSDGTTERVPRSPYKIIFGIDQTF